MAIEIVRAGETNIERFAPLIPGLIHATGPVSYGYQFGRDGRALKLIVEASWRTPQTLFSAGASTLALEDGELLGLELGFHGPDFYTFKANVAALAPALINAETLTLEEAIGVGYRAQKASYLNAHVLEGAYYLFALAVFAQHRGRGIGAKLFSAALARAKSAGHKELQLDVLADNPAVEFYRAMGMEIVVEIRSPELSRDHSFPSEYRMALPL